IWLAQVVSQAGDWFNKVAVLSVLSKLVGTEAAIGLGLSFALENAVRLLPLAALSPLAGPLADRLPRRALMVGADLSRVAIVLAMLTVDSAEETPRLYLLIALQMGLGIVFDAARQAAVPSTVERRDLHEAIALTSATWSVMLSLGALLGGLAVTALGARGALMIDAGTYVVEGAPHVAQGGQLDPAEGLGHRGLRQRSQPAQDRGADHV
ncbi:MAG: MFS transporter, partial [Pseudomonadota bacterium]